MPLTPARSARPRIHDSDFPPATCSRELHPFPREGQLEQNTTTDSRCPRVGSETLEMQCQGYRQSFSTDPAVMPAPLQDFPPSRDEPPVTLPRYSTRSRGLQHPRTSTFAEHLARPRPRRTDHAPPCLYQLGPAPKSRSRPHSQVPPLKLAQTFNRPRPIHLGTAQTSRPHP